MEARHMFHLLGVFLKTHTWFWANAGLYNLSYLELEPLGVRIGSWLSVEWSFLLFIIPLFSVSIATGWLQQLLNWSPDRHTFDPVFPLPCPEKKNNRKLKLLDSSQDVLLKMEVCSCHFPVQNPSKALIKTKLFINLAQPVSPASLLQNCSPGHANL